MEPAFAADVYCVLSEHVAVSLYAILEFRMASSSNIASQAGTGGTGAAGGSRLVEPFTRGGRVR